MKEERRSWIRTREKKRYGRRIRMCVRLCISMVFPLTHVEPMKAYLCHE